MAFELFFLNPVSVVSSGHRFGLPSLPVDAFGCPCENRFLCFGPVRPLEEVEKIVWMPRLLSNSGQSCPACEDQRTTLTIRGSDFLTL